VNYVGYSGGRGLVNQETRWAQAGYAHFIMDTRGQGYGGTLGETADPHPTAGEVAYAGLMTRGAGRREDYYYRRVYVDAFRAVEAAQSRLSRDPDAIVSVCEDSDFRDNRLIVIQGQTRTVLQALRSRSYSSAVTGSTTPWQGSFGSRKSSEGVHRPPARLVVSKGT
jgi:hypothetical protein